MFYFHVKRGDHLYLDPDGTELADLDAARDHAVMLARKLAREPHGPTLDLTIEIGDGRGHILDTVPLSRTRN